MNSWAIAGLAVALLVVAIRFPMIGLPVSAVALLFAIIFAGLR
jgi:hypothetical protein